MNKDDRLFAEREVQDFFLAELAQLSDSEKQTLKHSPQSYTYALTSEDYTVLKRSRYCFSVWSEMVNTLLRFPQQSKKDLEELLSFHGVHSGWSGGQFPVKKLNLLVDNSSTTKWFDEAGLAIQMKHNTMLKRDQVDPSQCDLLTRAYSNLCLTFIAAPRLDFTGVIGEIDHQLWREKVELFHFVQKISGTQYQSLN